ncbi:MAG: PorP/SprF family type IX secretion system membrane protein [Filimonas sp.]|nr:PorP/SprF family type IX secretion system membrane protein [Filimonas sp.]
MTMRYLIITILACICVSTAYAQDVAFSQFNEKPLLRNPALAGVFHGDLRISGIFRSQWQSVTVPYRTVGLSGEYKLRANQHDDWVTLGIQALQDVAGDLNLSRTQILPVINYHKSLNGNKDDYLSLAFMGGPVNSQFDPSKLRTDEQYGGGDFDPTLPTGENFSRTGYSYWDASTGLVFSSSFSEEARFYIGAGIFHFNKPKLSFYTSNSNVHVDPKYVLNAGVSLPSGEVNRLDIFTDYFVQGGNRQWLMGFSYLVEFQRSYELEMTTLGIAFGANYRYKDAFIPVVKLEAYPFSIGISYDVNTSPLKTASNWRGGLELTATMKAKLTNRSYYQDRVRCITY